MFNLQLDSHYVTLPDGTVGEIVEYLGSNIFKVKYMHNNNNFIMGFNSSKLKFNGNDVEYLKRKFSK